MDQKIKKDVVLIITPFFSPNIGGVETEFNDNCNFLIKKGYKVIVLTYQPLITKMKNRPPKKEISKNLEIYRYFWFGGDLFHKLLNYPFLDALYLTPCLFVHSIIFMLKRHKEIDVVFTPGINATFIGMIIKKIFKKGLISSTHAIYNFKRNTVRFFVKKIFSAADYILAVSRFSKEELIDLGVPKNKLMVNVAWADHRKFNLLDKNGLICHKKKLGLSENDFIVLYVGRFLKKKGIASLLETAHDLQNIKFIFIGTGEMESVIRKESKEYKNIIYLEKAQNDALNLYYNIATVSIMPSQYLEAFGRVVIESLLSGTPVIASKTSGVADYLSPEVGLIIIPDTPNIKRAVLELYNNPEKLNNMALKARDFALKYFSEKNGERFLEKAVLLAKSK